jgi:hypothetical protein
LEKAKIRKIFAVGVFRANASKMQDYLFFRREKSEFSEKADFSYLLPIR